MSVEVKRLNELNDSTAAKKKNGIKKSVMEVDDRRG